MKFERAKETDLPVIGEILAAAREYLRAQGLDQWQKYAPTAEDTAEHFRRGEQYVLREERRSRACAPSCRTNPRTTASTARGGKAAHISPFTAWRRLRT